MFPASPSGQCFRPVLLASAPGQGIHQAWHRDCLEMGQVPARFQPDCRLVKQGKEGQRMIQNLNQNEIQEILENETVGRIGCCLEGKPYVVPVSYIYESEKIYCHSAEGKKLEILRRNPQVCFEVDHIEGLARWECVICQGRFEELEKDEAEKAKALLFDKFLPMIKSRENQPAFGGGFYDSPEMAEKMLHAMDVRSKRIVFFRITITEKTGRCER